MVVVWEMCLGASPILLYVRVCICYATKGNEYSATKGNKRRNYMNDEQFMELMGDLKNYLCRWVHLSYASRDMM